MIPGALCSGTLPYGRTRIEPSELLTQTSTEVLGYETPSAQRTCRPDSAGQAEDLSFFLQEDPLGLKAAPSLYAYVQNSPAMFGDPTGEIRTCIRAYGSHFIGGRSVAHHFMAGDPPPSRRKYFNLINFVGMCPCNTKIDAPGATVGPLVGFGGANPVIQFYQVYPPNDTATFDVSVSTSWVASKGKVTFDQLASELTVCYDCN